MSHLKAQPPVSLDTLCDVQLSESQRQELLELERRRREVALCRPQQLDKDKGQGGDKDDWLEASAQELERIADQLPEEAEETAAELRDVADAIRGIPLPARGAKVMIEALYSPLVPQYMKNKPDGVLRVRIGQANEAAAERKKAIQSAPATAVELFSEFQLAVDRLRMKEAGDLARQFFVPMDNGLVLIKTLEVLINDHGSEVADLLREDAELAGEVADAPQGRAAAALLNFMQDRAHATIKVAREAAERCRNNGAGARTSTGKTERHRLNRAERMKASVSGGKGK